MAIGIAGNIRIPLDICSEGLQAVHSGKCQFLDPRFARSLLMTAQYISIDEDHFDPIHPLPRLLPAHALPLCVRTGVLAESSAR